MDTEIQRPDPERAAFVALLYSYPSLHDLGDATQERIRHPMGAWLPWVQEVRSIAARRLPGVELELARVGRAA